MGRKKKKAVSDDGAGDDVMSHGGSDTGAGTTSLAPPPPPPPPDAALSSVPGLADTASTAPLFDIADASTEGATASISIAGTASIKKEDGDDATKTKTSSGYAMTSHSGEILQEDIYVSDGSEDEDEDNMEVVLVGSRMGVMRRGLHHPSMMHMVQPNREWVRGGGKDAANETGATGEGEEGGEAEMDDAAREEQRRLQEEEELAKLDPAQRAARLLQEKQRKLEEAKELARRVESEENAGRDPALFSKRTAFDIRFDQIDDKPWTRGTGDMSDFFNYGLSEDDWLEYAQQQLMIRQELTDSSRQKRAPDPNLVPVAPRAPKKQNPRVAVAGSVSASSDQDGDGKDGLGTLLGDDDDVDAPAGGSEIGPSLVLKDEASSGIGAEGSEAAMGAPHKPEDPKKDDYDVAVGVGGAWGAGAPPGSKLAQLIEEQERKNNEASSSCATTGATAAAAAAAPPSVDEHTSENHYAASEAATEEDAGSQQGSINQSHHSNNAWAGGQYGAGGGGGDVGYYGNQRYDPSGGRGGYDPTGGRGGYDPAGGRGGGGGGGAGGWHDRSSGPPIPPSYRGGGGRGYGGGRGFGGGRGRGRGGYYGGPPPPPQLAAYGQPPPPQWDDRSAGAGSAGAGDFYARKRPRDGNEPRDPRDPRWRR